MRVLVFTTLYPNAAQPHHGIFVENRLRHVLKTGGISAQVIAPVPWFPIDSAMFRGYAAYARAPRYEVRHGVPVHHPRYPVIPKHGMNAAPRLMYAFVRRTVRRVLAEFDFDLIDAHYFYPDGVAAAQLAREFRRPFVVTGRGTDLNLIPRYQRPRSLIQRTAAAADGLITVCEALKTDLCELGIPRDRVRVLRNGVDLTTFHPVTNPAVPLPEAGRGAPLLLSVGHLIERKGHDLVIKALAQLPEASLLVVGTGPLEGRLKALARETGVAARVRFVGSVSHEELKAYYSVADCLVLASSREGWPNVLLESLACGTPVVCTPVDGSPEVVRSDVAGRVVETREPRLIADAVRAVVGEAPSPEQVRVYAEAFSWDETVCGQLKVFQAAVEQYRSRPRPVRTESFRTR